MILELRKILKAVFFLWILLLNYSYVKSQNYTIAELKSEIGSTLSDSTRALRLIELGRKYQTISFDSALYYIRLSKDYFDTSQISIQLIEYHYYSSEIKAYRGDLEQAIGHLDTLLDIDEINHPKITHVDITIRKAQSFIRMGSFDEATSLLLEALKSLETSDNLEAKSSAYGALGTIMNRNERWDEAIDYYRRSHELSKKAGNDYNAYGTLANVAIIHSKRKEYNLSIPLFKEVLEFGIDNNQPHLIGIAQSSLGLNYLEQDILDTAEYHLLKTLEINRRIKNRIREARTSSQLSKLYNKQGAYQKSIDILRPHYKFVEEGKNFNLIESVTRNLSAAYKGVGNFETALQFQERHTEIQDTIRNETTTKAVNDAIVKYETDKKEAEIQRLALEDELSQLKISRQRLALGISILGLGLLSYLLYRLFSQKSKIESQNQIISQALSEKDTLLREIHHRVKNNLQVISSLLGIQSRGLQDPAAIDALQESRSRVQSMSLIHQNLYQKDNLTGIRIGAYLEKLCSNIMNTYSLGNEISIMTEVDDLMLDVDTVVPLGLVINELITNALKYAFPQNKGTIHIKLFEQNKQLILEVRDDGKGMTNPEQTFGGAGYGYELIHALVHKLDGEINIDAEKGTFIQASLNDYKVIQA